MTLHDICERLDITYEDLVSAVIDVMELVDKGIYTIEVIDALDRLHEEE